MRTQRQCLDCPAWIDSGMRCKPCVSLKITADHAAYTKRKREEAKARAEAPCVFCGRPVTKDCKTCETITTQELARRMLG